MSTTFDSWRAADEAWVREHQDLVDLAFRWFRDEGEWPTVDALSRYLFRSSVGSLDPRQAVNSRPPIPGQLAISQEERLILGARHLLGMPTATPLLELLVAATLEAVEAYRGPAENPSVRYDNERFFRWDSATVVRLTQFLHRDHPNAFGGGAQGEQWDLLVDAALVANFGDIVTPADYVDAQLDVIAEWAAEAELRSQSTGFAASFESESSVVPGYAPRIVGSDMQRWTSELDELEAELAGWSHPDPPGLQHWRDRLNTLIREIVSPTDALAIRFSGLRWGSSGSPRRRTTSAYGPQTTRLMADSAAFEKAKTDAAEIIKTLRWHLERLAPATAPFSDSTVDPELWEHVRLLVDGGDWEKVAREAAVFVETKLREWAAVPSSVTGSVNVFKAAIGPDGFKLGSLSQASERDGWRQLATGFALALRNPSGHQVNERADAARYALGVLGTASLLLTQIRHQYGDPPAP